MRVLDLFAGTGALGIEALSRGAGRAVFVERDRAALAALRENLETLGLEERARVVAGTAEHFLDRLAAGERFDLVFLDPPFDSGSLVSALGRLASSPALAPLGFVVAEHAAGEPPEEAGWQTHFRRDYGSVGLTILGRAAEAAEEER